MKKSNGKRNIVITAIILTFIIFFNQIPANADVTDNLQNSIAIILGHVDDTLGTSFEQSTTNGKLNQMKKVVDTLDTSMDQMISPYVGSLTLWVDSNSGTYAGQTVTVTNAKGQSQTGRFVARNGHYEVDFPSLIKGSYTIAYPYVASSKILNLTTSVTLNGSAKRQQLFGDLQQMTIADIQACCKAGAITSIAKVGDTFSDGTYTYTIIGINQDKPSDASGNALSKNQYGDVLTVMPLGAPKGATNGQPVTMNASATPFGVSYALMTVHGSNSGSWASSQMRSTTMPQYLAKLPQATQNAIGYVQKVTGTYNGINSGGGNSVTGDKCFLLSGKEIFGGSGATFGSWCTRNEANATFQYQYFQSIATTPASRNINSSANQYWWLRSPNYYASNQFCLVGNGSPVPVLSDSDVAVALNRHGVFAAFCIY
ncbi:MAG: DUF6273 domain-containing protein [Roseburia faecis]